MDVGRVVPTVAFPICPCVRKPQRTKPQQQSFDVNMIVAFCFLG